MIAVAAEMVWSLVLGLLVGAQIATYTLIRRELRKLRAVVEMHRGLVMIQGGAAAIATLDAALARMVRERRDRP